MNQEMNCENTEMEQQTELFDFDSDDNRTSAKTPALKAIGGGIKDKMEKLLVLVYGWLMKMQKYVNGKKIAQIHVIIHVWII